MQSTVRSFTGIALSALLVSVSTLFTSCSKEQEASPATVLSAAPVQADAISFGPAVQGASLSITYPSGSTYYTGLSGHSELASSCRIEFWQGTQLVLVARHSDIIFGNSSTNDGAVRLFYTIPAQLPAGAYTLVLRTESANESLQVATTSTPATYIHELSDPITVDPGRIRSATGLIATVHSVNDSFFESYTLNWNTASFTGTDVLRAFAKNASTGTIYQLTPANGHWYIAPTVYSDDFSNSGSETVYLNEPGQPQFLPDGYYGFSIDNSSTKYIIGDGAPVSQ